MTITRVQTDGPIVPWCRGMGCTEHLDWKLVDREDGSGLHALCTELIEPAKFAGVYPTGEAAVLDLLRDKLGAAPIQTVELPKPVHADDIQPGDCERCDSDAHCCPGCGTPLVHGIEVCEPCQVIANAGPCRDAWCKDKPNPCGFDVAAHIAAHGPRILIEGTPARQEMTTITAGQIRDLSLNAEPSVFPVPPPSIVEPAPAFPTSGSALAFPVPALSTALLDASKAAPALFSAPAGAHPLKAEMIKIIRWYDSSRPRSLQREIGMSEVGVECLRRLAYSALETPPVNTSRDPWFAIIGTSVHAWLADALTAWNGAPEYGGPAFQVEQRVTATDGTIVVPGSTDFYRNAKVGDHKIVGPDALKRTRDHGPSAQYVTQVQVNGLAWEQAGWPVDEVALLLYPRSGYLDGMHVWSQPYNRQVALDALARLSSVKATASVLGPAALPATADRGCVFCPFWRAGSDADSTGCPGK